MQVLIMAAGRGTRMKSNTPKVLHTLAGLPLIDHVIRVAKTLNPTRIGVIIDPEQPQVRQHLESQNCIFFEQNEKAKGTGHAIACAHTFYQDAGCTLVLCGDTPLLSPATLQCLAEKKEHHDLVLATMRVEHDRGYGRCQMDDHQYVQRIVEKKDQHPDDPPSPWVNAGLYIIDHKILQSCLPHLQPSPTVASPI